MANQGAKVALADVVGDRATEAAARLKDETGAQTLGIACDIADLDDVHRMISSAQSALGDIDIMVNTAAIVADKTFMESTPEDWKQMLDICLYGSMNVIHAVLPGMVERNYGRIVCLASDAARTGQARHSYYAAAKGGVISFGKIGRPRSWTQRRHAKCRLTGRHRHGTPSGTRERSLGSDRRRTLRQARANHPPHVSDPPAWTTRRHCRRHRISLRRRSVWVTGQVLSINGGFAMV